MRHVEKRARWLAGALLVVLALAVAACGATPSGPGTGVGSTSPAANGTTPVSSARATVAATAHATSTPDQVVLVPGAAHYATSDSISVVVRNASGNTVYMVARFTDCSIVSLERLVSGSWQPVNLCADGYPHPYVAHIAPGGAMTIQMSAAASSDANPIVSPRWPAGTYRAHLTYSASEAEAFGQGTAVYSATFSVG